jgi:hypothetical protein
MNSSLVITGSQPYKSQVFELPTCKESNEGFATSPLSNNLSKNIMIETGIDKGPALKPYSIKFSNS